MKESVVGHQTSNFPCFSILLSSSVFQRLYFKHRHATFLGEKGCATTAKKTRYSHGNVVVVVIVSHKNDMGD